MEELCRLLRGPRMLQKETAECRNTVMAAQTGVAGSTKIGEHCIIAGQVGIAGHLTIANNTTIGAQAGVLGKVRKEGEVLMGSPAFNLNDYMRSYAIFKRAGK